MPTSVTPSSLLLHHTEEFLKHLPGLRDGSVAAFHDARVATRRMRELLPLAAVSLTPSQLDDLDGLLRRMTSRLGRVRDVDVTIALLQPLQGAAAAAASDVARVLAECATRRERRLRRAIKSMERQDVERQFEDLRQALSDRTPRFMAARRRLSAAPLWEASLDARIRECAGQLAAAIRHAGGVRFANRLHATRIAAKKLRYAIEIANLTGRARLETELRALRKAQEVLGTLHDYDVLAAALLGAPAAQQHLGPFIDLQRRRQHDRYLRRRDELLAVCGAAARAATRQHRATSVRHAVVAGALPFAVLALPIWRRRAG